MRSTLLRSAAITAFAASVLLTGCHGRSHQITVYRDPDAPAPPSKAVRSAFQLRVPDVSFTECTLENWLAYLSDFARVQFVIHWDTIEAAGMQRGRPIAYRPQGTVKEVLESVLKDGAGDVGLRYETVGDVVIIGTPDDFKELFTQVFDVRPILHRLLRHPEFDWVAVDPTTGRPVSLPGLEPPTCFPSNEPYISGRGEIVTNRLTSLITSTVIPDSWAVNGGVGTLMNFDGLLSVHNTARAQRAVEDLLNRIYTAQHHRYRRRNQ